MESITAESLAAGNVPQTAVIVHINEADWCPASGSALGKAALGRARYSGVRDGDSTGQPLMARASSVGSQRGLLLSGGPCSSIYQTLNETPQGKGDG